MAFHQVEGIDGKLFRMGMFGTQSHAFRSSKIKDLILFKLKLAPEVTIRDHAKQNAILVDNCSAAKLFASHFHDHFRHLLSRSNNRQSISGMHQITDPEQQLFADGAAGMELGKIRFSKVFVLQQSNRQSVSDRQSNCCAGSGNQSERLVIFGNGTVQNDISAFCQRGSQVSCQSDDRHFYELGIGDHRQQFFGGAAVGNGDHDIIVLDHSDIAMHAVGSVQKNTRRACTGKGRRYLAGNDSCLAQTCDHHFPGTVDNQFKRFLQSIRTKFSRCFDNGIGSQQKFLFDDLGRQDFGVHDQSSDFILAMASSRFMAPRSPTV